MRIAILPMVQPVSPLRTPRSLAVCPTSKSTDLYISASQHISQHSAAGARGGKDESRWLDEGLRYAFAPTERDAQIWYRA